MNLNKQSNFGFSIIELIIVIVIIGILSTITVVSYTGVQSRAVIVSLKSDLSNAVDFLQIDKAQSSTGVFPTTLAFANGGRGVVPSPGTTFNYTVNNSNTPKTFCLTATKGTKSYFTTQDGALSVGACPVLFFDVGVATSYPGTGATLFDLSGSTNNGNLVGGVTYSSDKKGVLIFNGVDGRVESPIQTYGNNTTWTAWVKCYENISSYNMFMGRHLPYFAFYGGNSMFFSNQIGGTQRTIQTTSSLSLNTWYHAAFTSEYDGTNTTDKIYVNGDFKISGSWAGTQSNSSYNFVLGDGHTPAWYPFKGEISQVRVYNYALTSDEISQDYAIQHDRYGL